MSSLADRILEARETAELTQTALARRAGVSQPMIARLENGADKETTKLVPIALATRHSAYWLATGKGPKLMGELEAILLELGESEQREALAFIQGLKRRA